MQVSRFKGLGEMNPEQLWETTMNPANRDAGPGRRSRTPPPPTSVFSMLMGDQVEPRREFIEQNAKDVKFLDV